MVLRYLMDRHAGRLDRVCETAGNLKNEFSAVYPLLDRLCELTCPSCRAPCCQVADPRFDLRDLIFVHFTHAAIPIGQPRDEGFTICRFLGPAGCILPRASRPWICTWYLCPSQKALLNKAFSGSSAALQDSIKTIKSYRKQLESRWLGVTR